MVKKDKVIVIGAGIGGLTAAVDLARRGAAVTVLERASAPGGKMRQVLPDAAGAGIDAGPTVFTMRWIFESLFADAGARIEDYLTLKPASTLARHAWRSGGTLDLFADIDRSADAIAAFAGPREAQGYRDFCARSADVYRTLANTFIAAQRPSPLALVQRVGLANIGALWRTAPYATLWSALGQYFRDPRLRQLFARYATYVGSSPMLAPATLMLVAHVEQDGVWMVEGGMRRVAEALQALGTEHGAIYRFDADVREIVLERGHVTGVILATGERLAADAVIFNGDASALAAGLLGKALTSAAPVTPRRSRSLSAITWCLRAKTRGFPLHHHNVFFAEDYGEEFHAIFDRRDVTSAPTVYVCAQDRGDGAHPDGAPERLLVLINAPPDGDGCGFDAGQIAEYETRAFGLLQSCGLEVERTADQQVITTPEDFDALFPATGGALYGRASHGPMATFERPGAKTRVPGLYLAGGSVHPGPGVPMAAMSGRLAAACCLDDLVRFRRSGNRFVVKNRSPSET